MEHRPFFVWNIRKLPVVDYRIKKFLICRRVNTERFTALLYPQIDIGLGYQPLARVRVRVSNNNVF